jgi:hypothetical protein
MFLDRYRVPDATRRAAGHESGDYARFLSRIRSAKRWNR